MGKWGGNSAHELDEVFNMPTLGKVKIRTEIWSFVSEECYLWSQSQPRTPSNGEMADYIEPLLQSRFQNRPGEWSLPSRKTISNRLPSIRKSWDTSVDEPFSSGNARLHGISDEAMPEVMEVWRYCKIAGTKFTAREAKRVAQFRGIIASRHASWTTSTILQFARRYAAREVAVASTRKPNDALGMDTSDLDALLLFDKGTTGLLAELERIPKPEVNDFFAGMTIPNVPDIPPEKYEAVIGPFKRSVWKWLVEYVIDCGRNGYSRFIMDLPDARTKPDASTVPVVRTLANEIHDLFDSGYDVSFWMKEPYMTACIDVWGIWASYFIDKGKRWGLPVSDINDDERELILLFKDLAIEACEYFGQYLPANYSSAVSAMNSLDEKFKPSASLMARAGLEG